MTRTARYHTYVSQLRGREFKAWEFSLWISEKWRALAEAHGFGDFSIAEGRDPASLMYRKMGFDAAHRALDEFLEKSTNG